MKRILLLSLLLLPIVALAQYPTFSNKQKLGVQTTGDGLIFRGNSNPNYNPSNINNAYFHLDTTLSKLYLYSVGTWQLVYPTPQFDTTTLNVYLKISDTTAMLLPYFRDSDTTSLNLISRFALKLNISDTVTMLTPYLRKADTISLSNRINLKLNISDTTILSNRITTNANNIIIINNKLNTKLDTIYKKLKNVVTRVLNKDTLDLGSSLTDGYAINIIGDSVNVDTTLLDIRYPDRDSTNELQDITFATTSGVITISGSKVMNLDTLYSSVIDSVNLLIRDSIAAFTPLTEGYGINIIGDSINVDTSIIFIQSDTITLSNRIDLKLNKSDTISLSNRIDIKLNASDTVSLSNRINTKLDTIYVNYQTSIDTIVNKDTINITSLEAGAGINITNNVISLDTTLLDSVVRVQNIYVKNDENTTLLKGEAVYVTGANGTNILVKRASNVAESSSSKTLGLTMTSIPSKGFGYVVKEGLLAGLNTNSADSAGVPIWLGVNGALIYGLNNKPYAPNHLVYLGVVTRKNPNVGEVYVTVQNGFEIKELHDVQIIDPANKASLYYNLSESLWRDTTAALLVSDTVSMLSKYVNTYSNQTGINGDKTFNNVITIDSATVTGKLLVNTNISDAVKINSNTNSTNLELMNSGGSVYIKSSNKNMTLQTDTTALVYLKGDVNRVGILTMNPQQALEVAGTIRVDSLSNSLIPVKLVGGSNSNDLTNVELGTGLSFINDTLKIADNIINSGDTATLLRYDYYSITTNKLVWTEGNKKLIPYFTQVYRNGQLLKLIEQYLFSGINNDTITLQTGNYKLGDNITVIAIDNIVALAGSGGYISLQGHVSGSGTNSINTTINNGVVTNSMLAGSISNDKLDVITATNKVSNSATTATNNNTINTIVSRDGSGNFSAGTITASLNGNANTSTTLATGRTISITGDLTYTSPSFNGSANVTAVGTLANSGVTANTYTAATVTVDAKGRITSASNNTIPTVNDGTLTMVVSGNGLTGSQTFTANQSSAATFTVTSNATSNNTENTIVYRDAYKDFSARNITASNFYGNATTAGFAYNLLSITGGPSALVNFSINTASLNGVRTVTIPDNNVTMATTNLNQTFGGTQTFSNTISGSINGNAATVTTNANLTGDVTSTGNSTTLSSVGTAGTYRSVTTDIKGRVTAGTNPTTLSGYGITDAVPSNRTITINGTAQDLSINRTWNVGTVTSVGGTGTVSGLTLTGTVSSTGNLTLGGTLSLTSGNVTTALGYTPYNSTNPNGYITSSALSPYATLASPTFTGTVVLPSTTSIGTVTNTEIGYVDGVTSAIQTQLNNKLNLTGGTLSNSLNNTLTVNSIATNTSPNISLTASASSPGYHNTNIGVRGVGQTIYSSGIGLQGEATQTDMNGFGSAFGIQGIVNGTGAGGNGSTYGGYFTNTTTVAGNNYGLYVTTASGGDYGIYQTGTGTNYFGSNTGIGGKLDVSSGIDVSGNFSTSYHTNVSALFRGYQVLVAPNNDYGQTRIHFPNRPVTEGFSDFGSGIRHKFDGSDARNSFTSLYTSSSANLQIDAVSINSLGNVGIRDTTPSYTLDVNGTLGVTGTTTLSNLGSVGTGVVVTSNTGLLSTATTVGQTGIMTTGNWSTSTGASVATFDVTHNLGVEPSSVIITPQTINGGATKIFYEVIGKTNSYFRVQAFNLTTGSPATNTAVNIYWIAIK